MFRKEDLHSPMFIEISQELDPLEVDDFMTQQLPVLNKRQDTAALINATTQILERKSGLDEIGVFDAQASARDLGMLAASLKRHGVEAAELPALEKVLLTTSGITDEVPRDTVYSYGPRNPKNHRMRTFTGLDEERIFITSFSEGINGLSSCTQYLLSAREVPIEDPVFAELVSNSTFSFRQMTVAMAEVRTKMPPETFTFELRPYFEPVTVGGKTYMAPGGAQMPLVLVDRILWGLDSKDPSYQEYYEDNLQYLPPSLRVKARNLAGVSLVDKVIDSSKHQPNNNEAIIKNLDALLLEIYKFRVPHRKTAEENFKLRPGGSKGSGGYNENILDLLVSQTVAARHKLSLATLNS